MSKPFSTHEFFIEEGDAFTVAVEAHPYFSGGVADDAGKPGKELENARLRISSAEDTWEIKVSIPKAALEQLVRLAQKYLKDGKGEFYMSPVA